MLYIGQSGSCDYLFCSIAGLDKLLWCLDSEAIDASNCNYSCSSLFFYKASGAKLELKPRRVTNNGVKKLKEMTILLLVFQRLRS